MRGEMDNAGRTGNASGPPKIFAAIAGVINDIGVVSKDKVNKQQGF